MKQTLPTTEMEPGSGGYDEAPEVSTESEKPKSFKEAFAEARSAGDKTFTWNGKKYTTEFAGSKSSAPAPKASAPAPAPKASAPAPAPKASAPVSKEENSGDQYSGRAELAKRLGTQAMRDAVKPDIKAEDIRAAKKAGEERLRRERESFFDPFKQIAARIGTSEMREKYKSEGYAKGGVVSSASKRADGCAQRGKTKGRIL